MEKLASYAPETALRMRIGSFIAIALVCGGSVIASEATAQTRISIVGSSTVFPFASAVAEEFSRSSDFASPIVESTGTGGGFKIFCSSGALNTPSISNASRRVKESEYAKCKAAGVSMLEVPVGFDGIVVGQSRGGILRGLTNRDLFLALASKIPTSDGSLIPNPNTRWKDVRSSLPDIPIRVYGPPPTSGTRDAFVELAMESGAKTFGELANLRKRDKVKFKMIAHAMREDGRFIEAGENDNLVVQKLNADSGAVGIFGYSFLEQNLNSLRGIHIDGVAPEFENILAGEYNLARLLYFYVKREHMGKVDGLQEFVDGFVSEDASGVDGYLGDIGLVPLPEEMRDSVMDDVSSNVAYIPVK